MTELDVLHTVRLKGRTTVADLASALGADPAGTVDQLVAAGHLVSAPALRITPDGRHRLADLLAAERADVDAAEADAVYQRFEPVNADFKATLSQWQVERADGEPDPARDARVLAGVDSVHQRVAPIVAAAAALLPRLQRYADRLSNALRAATEDDIGWLSRPLVDSYHTVWFELHEELIGLAGRTRDGD